MTDPTRPNPATGYPAQQPPNGYPPPNNYYYPNYNQQQQYYPPQPPHPPTRAIFFRRFVSALIATFIIFAVILFIVWLILRPRVPLFTLTSLTLTSLRVTPSSFSATCTANFTVVNPNHKLHVYYDQFAARLFYDSAFLVQNELPPFDQRKRNSTVLIATLVATSAYVNPKTITGFEADRKEGRVKLDLQMSAVVWFASGGWRARRRYLRVLCDDLTVSFTGNGTTGTMVGGSRRCAVVI